MCSALSAFVLATFMVAGVVGHGRLMDPVGRSSMWRKGYNTPDDYNDNQLFCGGEKHEEAESGRCGICGDPFDQPQPRDHEIGGLFYRGIIVANYSTAQVVDVTVQITANHLGFFQFKICPVQGFDTEAAQECLDRNILKLAGSDDTKYYITPEIGDFHVKLQLPADLQCEHCVLQWRYHGGNNWGICPDGQGRDGCGPQEEFYACADISVRK